MLASCKKGPLGGTGNDVGMKYAAALTGLVLALLQ